MDDFVAVMLGINMPDAASAERRAEIATMLMLHLRAEGRANISALEAIQDQLHTHGLDRALVRILDAVVWFSHPAAGVNRASRVIDVRIDPADER